MKIGNTNKLWLWISLALLAIIAPTMVIFADALSSDTSVTIGNDGPQATTVGTFAPACFNYQNSYSEFIYPASQLSRLSKEKPIESISFGGVSAQELKDVEFTVYIKNETGATQITASKSDLSEFTKFYEGKLTIAESADKSKTGILVTFPAQEEFVYAGDNIRIAVKMHTSATGTVNWLYQPSTKAAFACVNNDDAEERAPYLCNYMPVMTVTYAPDPVDYGEPVAVITTALEPGQDILLGAGTLKGGVGIDFGDGTVKEYPYPGNLALSNTLKGSQVKVYALAGDDDLKYLHCTQSAVTDISITAPELIELSLNNNLMTSVDLSGVPKLETLSLKGNQFETFECDNENIKDLDVSKNKLVKFKASAMTSLERLDVSINMLRTPMWLEWPEAENLKYLNVSFNALPELDVKNYSNLTTLLCNNNNFETVAFKNNTALETLVASFTGIKALDYSQIPNLKNLDLSATKIGNLSVSQLPELETLKLELNGLSSLHLASNEKLLKLEVAKNNLSSLDLSANKALKHLDYAENKIATLPDGQFSKLEYLNCKANGVSDIDFKSLPNIDTLYCQLNSIHELKLTDAAQLSVLDCSSNYLSSLDLSKSVLLSLLNCSDNNLASLDVSEATELISLDIHANQFEEKALNTLFRALPDINGLEITPSQVLWKGVLNYNQNPGTSKVSSEIPETKGWVCNVEENVLGDASMIFRLPTSKINTRYTFELATPDQTFYVDWGNGVKVPYAHESETSNYVNPTGIVEGTTIRVYAPNCFSLGMANAQIEYLNPGGMPELKSISCGNNNLAELDFTNNLKLEMVACRNNPLTSLLFGADTPLRKLSCENTLLRHINLQSFKKLEELVTTGNRLESLDLSDCYALLKLNAEKNNLSSIDLSGCPNLQQLSLSNNNLTEIDLSDCPDLIWLALDKNKLTSLDASVCNYLQHLDVMHNELTELKFESDFLKTLYVADNNLSDIKLLNAPQATIVTVENNNLTELSLAGMNKLEQIFMSGNAISNVDLGSSKLPKLSVFNATNNKLTNNMDLSLLPAMTEFVVENNNLAGTLDLTTNTNMRMLYVAHNQIETIKYPNSDLMIALSAGYNKLSTINAPSKNLSVIDAPRNNIAAVNVSNQSNLIYLNLDYNELTSLNLSKNVALEGVSIRANQFNAKALNSLFEQLPEINDLVPAAGHEYWMTMLHITGNPGAGTCDRNIAIEKGWNVTFAENLPVLRNLEIIVKDEQGNVVEGADITLLVDQTPVSLKPMYMDGAYIYRELEVFLNHFYAVEVSKPGYKTTVVDADDFDEGDVTLNIVLKSSVGVDDIEYNDSFRVNVENGKITVYAYTGFNVSVYDITGRMVANEDMSTETWTIDNLTPGLYIVNGKKVLVK